MMPSSTTAVSSTSATTPVALLAYQSAVLPVMPTECLPASLRDGIPPLRP